MQKNRYISLCQRADTGAHMMVSHPDSHEDGTIVSCIPLTDTVVVRTTDGFSRSWDFHDCDDLNSIN